VEAVETSNSADEQRQVQLREESTAELVKRLANETTTLVKQELEYARSEASRIGEAVVTLARQELQLAKAEMAEKGRTAGPGFGMIGAAGAGALLAAGTFTAFLVLALDGVMPNWLAALIVAAAWGVVAALLYTTGKSRVEQAGPLVPEQAVETIKEDIEWAKTQVASDGK
jgi:Putative Actinobacterial Holin-X, holin superfamily III